MFDRIVDDPLHLVDDLDMLDEGTRADQVDELEVGQQHFVFPGEKGGFDRLNQKFS